jgi:hypothetical protein
MLNRITVPLYAYIEYAESARSIAQAHLLECYRGIAEEIKMHESYPWYVRLFLNPDTTNYEREARTLRSTSDTLSNRVRIARYIQKHGRVEDKYLSLNEAETKMFLMHEF